MAVLPYTQASQSGVGAYALGRGVPLIVSSVGALEDLALDSSFTVPPGNAESSRRGDPRPSRPRRRRKGGDPRVRSRSPLLGCMRQSHARLLRERPRIGESMRVAFVAPNLNVGGAERQWATLVPELAHRGLTCEVFTLDGRGPYFEELAACGVRTTMIGSGRSKLGALAMAQKVAHHEPEVVVTTGVSAHVVGHIACRRRKAAHVAAMHSIPEHPLTGRQRAILRLLAPRVSASTVVTDAQRPFLLSLGFRPNRIWVVPNGVPSEEPSRARTEIRSELGVARHEFLALLVATLRPEKRVERFVDAITLAHLEDSRIRGVIAGGGPQLETVRLQCERTNGVVSVLGPRPDTRDLMCASDVVCLTSDAEALPLSLLEAMAVGRPIIATDVGGVRDAVVEGETGFLVEPSDMRGFMRAVVELARTPGLAERLGAAALRRHAMCFSVERMVDGYTALLEHLHTDRRSQLKIGAPQKRGR